ncbi:helix-turn-helix transcriptional regulator [Clostridium beijerinckii]|uniref:Helix-turn-helix transcriptional regulator n=1 Tax=Clostridium beijerinckii TaxID=1520 RepID=A0A7X9SMI0_CLOBE|nr:helix-turn-helix transcriptional regulator [Clostridium beijerinckii]
MNKTATFKSVFKDTENQASTLYTTLPETNNAQKIYKLRKMSGLSQKQFAQKIGIGYSSLCKYEIGYKISESNKKKICDYFDLQLD